MNTVRKAEFSDPAVVADADRADTPDRLLSCMAGFYTSDLQARTALRSVQVAQRLLPAQTLLLSPDDAGYLRFARLSRQWAVDQASAGPRGIGGLWLASAVGASLASLAALVILLWEAPQFDAWLVMMLMALQGLGGLLGAGLFALWVRLRPRHRFDAQVRQQLILGCWALVLHQVPWADQAAVVRLLRSTSLRWCASAPHSRRL